MDETNSSQTPQYMKVESDDEIQPMSLDRGDGRSPSETNQTNTAGGHSQTPEKEKSENDVASSTSPNSASNSRKRSASPTLEPNIDPDDMFKDKTLEDFLNSMDDYAPIIPDVIIDYYLSLSGFSSVDPRMKRLLGLTAQKFMSDVAQDAYQYSKIRTGTSSSASGSAAAPGAGPAGANSFASASRRADRGKTVLTVEDLGAALNEYGINLRRPDFFR
ncbi:SAGA complex/transcription factor TFIID complex subunit Taf10 [Schizosaccharomyces japonicus yFS275]|uniref:Transcription initiation factor TFIID subunit 10 n=1 Tax=Schizosaccharomyces japonicus (strain yFS275 / FY16936) TaxID=402676 RepID=B6JW17_SCHJY|nr:SAGA complex/transcription factor TFIID complex subunit Taf10 [Schizosaccharomyces japonicus yFS275]EEB05568.1 SAGA complex/transcription factor TFIID complex subunit Taf10 [Schizosaccharomyces japonicus yFS275]